MDIRTRRPQLSLTGLVVLALVLGGVVLARPSLAQESEGRYVAFPQDVSLGQLYIRDAGKPYITSVTSAGNGEGWRTCGEAQGMVEVPAGTELMLRVHPQAVPKLKALADLGPDDLRKLDAAGCNLKDADLAHIAHLTGLRSLVLHTNREIGDIGLDHLKEMRGLIWLSLERTSVTCDSPLFDRLPELQYLDVYDTQLTNAGFGRLCRLPKLKTLGIEGARVSPEGLSMLRELRTLEEANFEKTAVNDYTLAVLGRLPSLRILNLSRDDVTDEGLRYLAEAPSLEVLNITMTSVTDAGLEALMSAPRLRHVLADGTRVTQEALARLSAVTSQRNVQPSAIQAPHNPNAPRVGLLMSYFTATGPHWIQSNYGYQYQYSTLMADILEEADFDVYAIIEPGTATKGELPDLLESTHLAGKTIETSDAQALSQLNVIFVKSACNMRDDVIQSLIRAVQGGVGLVSVGGMGFVTPGANDSLAQLLCINNPKFFFRGTDVRCSVIAPHPILGSMKAGDAISVVMPEGYYSTEGSVRGQPLLKWDEESDEDFCPMYVSRLGKGRVVCMQWFNPDMPDSPFADRREIYTRAVNWAAGQPADAEW